MLQIRVLEAAEKEPLEVQQALEREYSYPGDLQALAVLMEQYSPEEGLNRVVAQSPTFMLLSPQSLAAESRLVVIDRVLRGLMFDNQL